MQLSPLEFQGEPAKTPSVAAFITPARVRVISVHSPCPLHRRRRRRRISGLNLNFKPNPHDSTCSINNIT